MGAQAKNVLEAMLLVFGDVMDKAEISHRLQSNLRRFYPKVYERLVAERRSRDGLEQFKIAPSRGVEEGYFQGIVNFDLAITLLRYSVEGLIVRKDVLLSHNMSTNEALVFLVVNFLRGISTEKGMRLIDDFLENRTERNNLQMRRTGMKRLILALTFGAFAAGSASAQLRLTLDDAIQMALSENPTIKVADLDVERYDYVKKETRGNLLPSLSASGEYTRAIEKVDDARRYLVRRRQYLYRYGQPLGAALRAGSLSDVEAEPHADRIGRRGGAVVAHYAGGRGEKGLLQYPAGRTVAGDARRVACDDPAHGGRYEGEVRTGRGLGVRLPDGAGGAEQSASDHYADEEFDSGWPCCNSKCTCRFPRRCRSSWSATSTR